MQFASSNDLPEETWKPVPDFDGYEVSNIGRVKSHKRKTPRIMKTRIDQYGYCKLVLFKKGKQYFVGVHRLVALAFLGRPPTPAHEVNHKNGVKIDNRVSNLEWVTRSENQLHAFSVLGRQPKRGSEHHNATLVDSEVHEIFEGLAAGEMPGDIALSHGLSRHTISAIANRRIWSHLMIPGETLRRVALNAALWTRRKYLPVDTVLKVVDLLEEGKRQSDIASIVGTSPSTVFEITKSDHWIYAYLRINGRPQP